MLKYLILVLLVSASITATAYDEPTIEQFFESKENVGKYETILASGTLEKARTQMVSICKAWNVGAENLDKACECATKEISKLADKEIFYVSVLAYERYLAKVRALENDDKEEFESLKSKFERQPLAPEEMESKCSKIKQIRICCACRNISHC